MTLHSVKEACKGLEGKLYDLGEDDLGARVPTLLKEACALVRRADPADPAFPDVVDRVSQTANVGISLAYGSGQVNYLPSFAHTRRFPLLQGPNTLFHIFSGSTCGYASFDIKLTLRLQLLESTKLFSLQSTLFLSPGRLTRYSSLPFGSSTASLRWHYLNSGTKPRVQAHLAAASLVFIGTQFRPSLAPFRMSPKHAAKFRATRHFLSL